MFEIQSQSKFRTSRVKNQTFTNDTSVLFNPFNSSDSISLHVVSISMLWEVYGRSESEMKEPCGG